MSFKLGHKIFLLVSIPLVFILLVLALFAFVQRNTISAAYGTARSAAVLAQSNIFWESMLDAEDNQRGYVLTADPSYLTRFQQLDAKVPPELAQLSTLVSDNPSQKAQVRTLALTAMQRLQHLTLTIKEIQAGNLSKTQLDALLVAGTQTMNRVRAQITEFNNGELQLHDDRAEALTRYLAVFNEMLVTCAIAAFVLSLLIMQIFSRILVKRLADLGDEAKNFGKGGTFERSTDKGNDEISQLHHAFFSMAEVLAEKQSVFARYELLVKSARDVIFFVTCDDLRIIEANDAAVQAHGYDRTELLSMTLRELRTPETLANLDSEIRRFDAGPTLFESRHRRKDGSTFPVEVAGRTTEIDGQRVLLTVVRDVTERKLAENEREKFFDRSNDLMGVASLEGYFTRINSAWQVALGHTIQELTGTPFIDFVHPDDRERTATTMAALNRGEAITSFENRYSRKDGSYVWLSWSAIPSVEEGLIYAVARDVTERKEIEAELAHSRDQAMEASRLKSQFLANMSHEIRTPMNGIVATSELLLRSKLSGDEREYAGIIGESARALLTIINQILDLSKLEATKLDLESAEFAPLTLAESVMELLNGQAAEKKLVLRTVVKSDVPAILRGDAGRLRQILLNLLGNALKFTERGAVELSVDLRGDNRGYVDLRFAVSDTGIGLSSQDRDRLFEPFTQADGSTSRRYGGTGLGLSISKRLVDLMNGEIGVESVLGVGSTFWFNVKFAKAGLGDQTQMQSVFRDRRLLIVDSDSTSCDVISRYAQSWGVRSISTADANNIVALLHEAVSAGDPFQFVIIDLTTADIGAWRLSEAIANDPALADTKLILATTLDAPERMQASDNFAAYLAKPVLQSQLHDCMVTASDANRSKLRAADEHVQKQRLDRAELADNGGARILLAEDHAINRRIAIAQLKELGLEADLAKNGQEAIDAYLKYRYDLILMDCQMPEVDGYAATRAIRAIQARDGGDVRIIAMTANAMEGDRTKCLEAGMDDYISKPVELDRLRDVILPILGRASSSDGHGKVAQVGVLARVLDSGRLRQVFRDDAEAICEVLELTISECRPLATEIKAAVAQRDVTAASIASHKFKGICGNVGADELAAIGQQIEFAVKSGDWISASEECSELDCALVRFVEAANSAQFRPIVPALSEAI